MFSCGLIFFCWLVLRVDFSVGALCLRDGKAVTYHPPTQFCLMVMEELFYHPKFRYVGSYSFDDICLRKKGGIYNNVTSHLFTADNEEVIEFLRGFMNYSSIDVALIRLNESVPRFAETLSSFRNKYAPSVRRGFFRYDDDSGIILVTPTGWENVRHKYFAIYTGYVICRVEPGGPDPPSCPKGTAVTTQTKDSLTLFWEPGFTESLDQSFVIKVQACQGVTRSHCLPDYVTEIQQNVYFGKMNHTFSLTNPKPFTNYTFTVDAKNPLGTSGNCTQNKITVTTGSDGLSVDLKPSAVASVKGETKAVDGPDINVSSIILGVLLAVAVTATFVLAFLYVRAVRGAPSDHKLRDMPSVNKDTSGLALTDLETELPIMTSSHAKTCSEASVKTKTNYNNDKGMKTRKSGDQEQHKSKRIAESTDGNEQTYENLNVDENVYEKVEDLKDNRASQHSYAPVLYL